MKRFLLCSAIVCAFAAQTAAGQEARLLRFPTTNGEDVVFSYAGDLYRAPLAGGHAERLTSHIGYEMFARFSPDGRTIAFTGQYDGNTEVYTMSATGGEPVRVTYTATNARDDLGDRMGPNNIVMGWTPDGRNILYRNRTGDSFTGKLWSVSAAGGLGECLPLPEGGFCCYSPDGKKLAYNRVFREFRTWKYYRGGQADEIWIYDGKSVKAVTDSDAQDIMPMWIGDEIFFISDRDHWMNVFVYNTKTGVTEKVTDFDEYDVKFPSTNGRLIVFENGGYLYKLDPATRKTSKIDITLNAEGLYARTQRTNVSSHLTAFSIAESGDRLAVTARGEVFSVPMKGGVVRNLTRTPGSNDRAAVCSPDGAFVAYVGDGTGETEVYLYDNATAQTRQLTTGSDTYIRSIVWAPDSKSLLYTDRKNRLVSVSIPDGAKKILMTCPEQEFRGVSFSADSQWITYTRPEANEMNVVYVYNLASGKETAVTERWYSSGSPIFSRDGKYLFFTSARDFNPTYSQIEWNYAYSNMNAMYMALLSKDTPSPFIEKDASSVEEKDSKKDTAQEPSAVKVDADGIFSRIIRIPDAPTMARPIWSDGKVLVYTGRGGVQSLDLSTKETKSMGEGNIMSAVGTKALVSGKGKYNVCDLSKGRISTDGAGFDCSGLVTDIDYTQEWAQIFDEAWRAFRDGFYLENMHGIDWQAMKRKYEVLLPYVGTRLDLNYVIGEMISELTCGHAYVSPGDYPKPERVQMGLLGAKLSLDKGGYYRIDHIYKGAPYSESLRSPLTEPGLGVSEGDYILAVDGQSVKDVTNIYSLLVGKAGVPTELTLSSRAGGSDPRTVIVKPVADEYPLEHYEWVMHNIEYVDKVSDGKIGYIYIPDMSAEGLNEFARYYYPQLDKEALIIDDRANGGGNVSPMIIERLLRDPYRLTMYRSSSLVGTIPEGSFVGPKVCLINKYSASDGDLFPWSFKATGLGELIGTRTWGGVIGISGSLPYMDGTDIRVPFFTNFDRKTGEWIIENWGVEPDIEVENDPIKEQAGIDEQLDKAVEVLKARLKDRKPLPGVPEPRDFSYKK